jgi:hypothetical protein
MEKTLFAGLTQLDPGEALSTDNASFQSENPPKIDRLLEIGAVTHRHNAHPAQANPGSAAVPGASAIASGGHIPADTNIYVGFTLLDFDQGETTLSPIVTVSTDTPIESPDDAPTTEVDYTGGGLVPDTYYYAISLLDAEGGETPLGPTTAVEREPGYASGRVLVSGLLAPVEAASAAGWRLWRAVGGGDLFYIASGATDTFMDDGTECIDCTLGPVNPESNLTNGDNTLLVEIPSGGAMATASAFSVYLSTDPSFDSGSLAGTYPIASAGTVLTFLDLLVEDHRPPDVSTCIPGASRIDPDTELIDWHWKRPVASAAVLPLDAEEGDVRVTLDDGVPHRFIDGAWGVWDMSGGGGDVTVPIETNWGTEPLSHVPIWQSASADVLWLQGLRAARSTSLVMRGALRRGVGQHRRPATPRRLRERHPRPPAASTTNAIHYPAMTPGVGAVVRWLRRAHVHHHRERVALHCASASRSAPGAPACSRGSRPAGNLEIATRTVDSDDDADFTIIATDPLPAAPANGDTYNLSASSASATTSTPPSTRARPWSPRRGRTSRRRCRSDFGTDVALEPGLSRTGGSA